MYHYIGFIWNPHDPAASRTAAGFASQFEGAPDWVPRLNLPGLTVFDQSPRGEGFDSYPLPEGTGIILGTVFPIQLDNWTPAWRANITSNEARTIAATGGRHLVENYWGGYVAFLVDPRDRHRFAIRDCSGRVACYRTETLEVEVVFADVGDLCRLNLPSFTINWRYIGAFLSSSQLQVRETGLNEVTELLAGDCLIIGRHRRSQVSLWDPRRFCADHIVEDSDQAADQLLATTQQCISAWASVYGSVIHSLSGGFDSAVVLGCLTRAPSRPLITCVNQFGEDANGDERRFARMAADFAGVKLIERSWSLGRHPLDSRLLNTPRTPKPMVSAITRMLDRDIRNGLAESVKAGAYWTGEGGDHLFFQMKSPLGVADYIQRHGVTRRLVPIVQDAARLAGVSFWDALCTGVRLGSKRPWSPQENLAGRGAFLNTGVRSSLAEYSAHPWTTVVERIPKGKQYQIQLLSEVLNRDRPLPGVDYAEAHHPLLSQPLIELSLRIPVYLLVKGGRPRGLARSAFQSIVPPEINERESKGSTTATVLALLRQSQSYLSDLMLDGLLVRQGILSRKALEPCILHTQPLRGEQLFPLLASIAAEVWARTWSEHARANGAA